MQSIFIALVFDIEYVFLMAFYLIFQQFINEGNRLQIVLFSGLFQQVDVLLKSSCSLIFNDIFGHMLSNWE